MQCYLPSWSLLRLGVEEQSLGREKQTPILAKRYFSIEDSKMPSQTIPEILITGPKLPMWVRVWESPFPAGCTSIKQTLNSTLRLHEPLFLNENPCCPLWGPSLTSAGCVVHLQDLYSHITGKPPPILPSCGEVKGGVWGVEDCVSSGPIKGPLCSPCVRSLIGCAAAVTQRHTVSSAHGQCSLKHTQVHICYCLRQPHHSTYNGQHWNPTELVQLTNTERKVLRWWIICRIVRT